MDQKTGEPEPFEDEIDCSRYDEGIPSQEEVIPYDDPRWDIDYKVSIPGLRKWRYGQGGALTTNLPIRGITQTLDDNCTEFYGYRHFIGESIGRRAMFFIAKFFDNDLIEIEDYDYKPQVS